MCDTLTLSAHHCQVIIWFCAKCERFLEAHSSQNAVAARWSAIVIQDRDLLWLAVFCFWSPVRPLGDRPSSDPLPSFVDCAAEHLLSSETKRIAWGRETEQVCVAALCSMLSPTIQLVRREPETLSSIALAVWFPLLGSIRGPMRWTWDATANPSSTYLSPFVKLHGYFFWTRCWFRSTLLLCSKYWRDTLQGAGVPPGRYLGGNPPTLPARGWYIVSVVVTGLMIDLSGLGIAVRRHCSSWMWPMLTLKKQSQKQDCGHGLMVMKASGVEGGKGRFEREVLGAFRAEMGGESPFLKSPCAVVFLLRRSLGS